MEEKVVVTITGIRPDFIRMSAIFKLLDRNFKHILIHTGQHYDKMLSDVFFEELEIRKPDYVLDCGHSSSNHYEQLSYLSTAIPKLFQKYDIHPDIILFLGDSNTVAVSLPLKKEGYRIGHIEAGMRSYDRRMLEEINRTVCDICSDIHFVYHEDYKEALSKENISKNVHVVGNTIVEVAQSFLPQIISSESRRDLILVDIHRPENSKDLNRMRNILRYCQICRNKFKLPVKFLYFKRTHATLELLLTENPKAMDGIEEIPLMSYINYMTSVYNSKFIISDSGTGQEEPALLGTPVIVPRDFTERPQSVVNGCSYMLAVNDLQPQELQNSFDWLDKVSSGKIIPNIEWLGDGTTSTKIISILKGFLM